MRVLVYGRVLCVSEGSPPPTASLRALIHSYVLTQAGSTKDSLVFCQLYFFSQKTQTSPKDTTGHLQALI